MNQGTRRTVTLFAAGSLALALGIAVRGRDAGRESPTPTAVAERRTLEVSLVEPGTLQAARSVTLASEIRSNRAKIVSLAADGTWVKPSDVVVAFDRTPFEEDRAKAEAELRDAEAAASRADQERKLQIAKAEQALESARHSGTVARLNLESYEKGSGALNVREAEVRAAESGSELERSRRDLADMEQMFAKGFVSQGELERQKLKVADLERQSSLQGDRLKAAREVIFPRDLERARGELAETRDEITRAEAVLYHTHEFYRAAVESADRKVETTRAALRAVEDELKKTVLTSPIEGFLVLQDIPLDSGKRKPQVGDSVWSGQPIATVPDLSQIVTLTRVRETDLHRIRQGLLARLDLEAYPDVVMNGRIDFIGSLAEQTADSPWKFFGVRLLVDRTDPRLRPGMSVRVSFLLDISPNTIVVPLDAVFSCGGRICGYVRRGGEVWERPLTLGLQNETHAEVKSGVAVGEDLLLSIPRGEVRREKPPAPNV
ncbi:MAG: efflux RND transporter periplasmic adaptor subunit [Candidatus Binatia bacterium]